MADTKNISSNQRQPSESSGKSSKKRTLAKVTRLFWVALGILIFLLMISILHLSTQMYSYVKRAQDPNTIEISIDELDDFAIFSTEYKDANGKTIVKSLGDDAVVAPNTGNNYVFSVKNSDDVPLDYTFDPKVLFTGVDSLPIEVKIKSFVPGEEGYIFGGSGDNGWENVEDLDDYEFYTYTIDSDEIHTYRLEWQWRFDSGNDELDTALGNGIEGKAPTINIGMGFKANVSDSYTGNSGFAKYGIGSGFWWWIFFILLLIAIILFIISLIHKKSKEPEPVVVYAPAPTPAPTPAPEPVPVPVVAPTAAPKKKQKGFVGKMAYVNIDTLVDIFNNGDRITLKIPKEKGLVDEKATQVKILARNDMVLNKAFHIETQGISAQARQKVIAAGGSIKIIDG